MLAAEKSRKAANNNNHCFDSLKIKQITESIKTYFSERKVSNLFVVKVVEKLAKSVHGNLMEKSQLLAYVKEIVRKCPNWLSLHDNFEGQILRLGQPLQMPEIYKLLEA
jgi:hypothetical protein